MLNLSKMTSIICYLQKCKCWLTSSVIYTACRSVYDESPYQISLA